MCSQSLVTLRLGCPECGTEVSGHFDACRYCRLDGADLAILEVFLRSRGNIRDVQAHLGVSYPTARARLGEVLERVGLGGEPTPGPGPRPALPTPDVASVLSDLAAGRIDVATAEGLIGQP